MAEGRDVLDGRPRAFFHTTSNVVVWGSGLPGHKMSALYRNAYPWCMRCWALEFFGLSVPLAGRAVVGRQAVDANRVVKLVGCWWPDSCMALSTRRDRQGSNALMRALCFLSSCKRGNSNVLSLVSWDSGGFGCLSVDDCSASLCTACTFHSQVRPRLIEAMCPG